MAIDELQCHEFRNIKNTSLSFNPKLNIIRGSNGSGKTSLLEAIYIIATTKSFRTNHLTHCINHNQSEFILYGKFTSHSAGIKKDNKKFFSKVNKQTISKRSDFAKYQSIITIDSESFNLLIGSKQKRREFLDWALFHVKPFFSDDWINYRKILKQRNHLLRIKQTKEIKYWDEQLHIFNEKIHLARKELLDNFSTLFRENNKNYEFIQQLKIEYIKGWKKEYDFKDALDEKFQADLKRGFTSIGNHRCDIKFMVNDKDVRDVFSRGQMKQLIILLNLTLIEFVSKNNNMQPILIIDDLVAELDKNTIKDVIVSLLENNYQIFISTINYDDFFKNINSNKTVFHVKHGEIEQHKEIG